VRLRYLNRQSKQALGGRGTFYMTHATKLVISTCVAGLSWRLESGDESWNENCFADRQHGRRDNRRAGGGARKGHGSPTLLRERFFKIDRLHLPLVIDNHQPGHPDIQHARERDKRHPVGRA
jgi:hypothetical protein